jgi:hypothetical protein
MNTRKLLAVGAAVAAVGITAAPASALNSPDTKSDTVAGVGTGSLALSVSTPASAFINFAPNHTATSAGAIVLTDTDTNWTLSAEDDNATTALAGHPTIDTAAGAYSAAVCSGSEASVGGSNTLGVKVTGITGIDSTLAGAFHQIGHTAVVVAKPATSTALPLAAAAAVTSYSLPIGASEVINTGCPYTMTVTYTLASA